MIKGVRIDHRLLHGQVAFAWGRFLNVERMIVIDNQSAGSELQKMTLSMAKPENVKLNVFSVEKAVEKADTIKKLKDNTFIIFGNTKEAKEFLVQTKCCEELNVGGIANKEGSKQFSLSVFLNDQEQEDLKAIEAAGIRLFMQQVPTTKREELPL